MSQDVVSFVLRFVREMGEDQQARWRGVIKHVQGDTESHFSQFSEALEFMQAHVNDVIRTAFAETNKLNEANPFMETARLWGEFMPRYTRLMQDSMTEAMQSGTAVTQQMEQALAATLSAWGLPTQTDQEQTLDRLAALTSQLTALTARIDELETHLAAVKDGGSTSKRKQSRRQNDVN